MSDPGAPVITEPRIYFGERPSDYVVVGARQPEFDYPASGTAASGGADQNTRTTWSGTTGITLDSTLTRLLFALRFRDLNLLISDQITSDTQLLMHRSLQDRVGRVAPFLAFDNDPYVVVDAAGVCSTSRTPTPPATASRTPRPPTTPRCPPRSGLRGQSFNYVRNSVKVTINAYDGTMTFYAADPSDPILRAYEGIFPALFQPLDAMPADLRAHLRVPEDLFDVQTRMYATYHVTDPETFFRASDLWTVPTTAGSQQTLPNEAYYVEMRMPGGPGTEFLLLQPMVPIGRPNMIAWVAARSDPPNYGQVQVFRFPQDTAVRGPNQIEAQIDADPLISSQFTLWSQAGSDGGPRPSHRRARAEQRGLPPAHLPAVDNERIPGLPEDHRRDVDEDRVGQQPRRCPLAAACRWSRTVADARANADAVGRTRSVGLAGDQRVARADRRADAGAFRDARAERRNSATPGR